MIFRTTFLIATAVATTNPPTSGISTQATEGTTTLSFSFDELGEEDSDTTTSDVAIHSYSAEESHTSTEGTPYPGFDEEEGAADSVSTTTEDTGASTTSGPATFTRFDEEKSAADSVSTTTEALSTTTEAFSSSFPFENTSTTTEDSASSYSRGMASASTDPVTFSKLDEEKRAADSVSNSGNTTPEPATPSMRGRAVDLMFKLMSVIFALGAATTTTRAPVVAQVAEANDHAIFIVNLDKYRINHIVEKEVSKPVSVSGCIL